MHIFKIYNERLTFLLTYQIIIKMAAANGVRRVWVGQNSLLSTPAVSAVIRERVGADVSVFTNCMPKIDISVVSVSTFSGPEGPFDVDVFDSTTDYVKLMK
ncbi:hypothetical protein BHE74_00022621 [Ensete ventricosum]|nr:hypothetical protein BHE74_00022621 [Ensete ventricosum]